MNPVEVIGGIAEIDKPKIIENDCMNSKLFVRFGDEIASINGLVRDDLGFVKKIKE